MASFLFINMFHIVDENVDEMNASEALMNYRNFFANNYKYFFKTFRCW